MMMENSNKETIREYTHRWNNKAMHVQPPLLEKEMVTLFANTFKALYYKHLMGSSAQHFNDAIVIAKRIKQEIRAGRISKPIEKKGFTRRKNDAEVSNMEERYKSKRNYQSQSYQTSSSQISNINFGKSLLVNHATNSPKNQAESNPRSAYPRN
jgi:hypothetical protein